MKRIKLRLERGQDLHYCQPWSISFVRNQLRNVHHIINGDLLMWSRVMCKNITSIPSMILHLLFSHDEVLGTHGWDGTTTFIIFVGKYGLNFADGIGSISYQIIILTIMKTSMYFILPTSEGSICTYVCLVIMFRDFCCGSLTLLGIISFIDSNGFSILSFSRSLAGRAFRATRTCCCLLLVWNLQEVVVKSLAHVYK